MEFNFENWLSNTKRAQDILQTIYEITEFSKGQYSPFFQNCGLYAIGSSLRQKEPNDIDLVLVGLDFRAVADYNNVFLQNPDTLIAEEIVIKPALARKRGVTNPLSFIVSQDGPRSLWYPLPENPNDRKEIEGRNIKEIGDGRRALEGELVEPDRFEDLDSIHQFMLAGIEHRGEYWAFNFQKSMMGGTALSLNNYCLRQGSSSSLVRDLYRSVASEFGQSQDLWHLETPFEPYFCGDEYFLTFRFSIHDKLCPTKEAFSDDGCDYCRPIDLIIHSENLHPIHWKQHQKHLNYPFAPIHEWERVDETTERPILTNLPYPEFIDPEGKARVKEHPYFSYLKDAPINIE